MPQQLTVLVFKDNLTARTFRIPLRWLTQFGWLLAALFLTVLLSLGIAVRGLVKNPSALHIPNLSLPNAKIQDLENQLKNAQAQIQALQQSGANTVTPEGSPVPVIDPAAVSPSTPITSKPFLFKGLPDQIQPIPSDPGSIPIAIHSPQVRWEGKILKVRFNLQYISQKPGGQQGRILILARGPGILLSHPGTAIQAVDQDYLLDPNHGEYFSVSRFRETKAEFGPVASHDWIKEVEVIVLGSNGQMLIHRKLTPGSGPQDASDGDNEQ